MRKSGSAAKTRIPARAGNQLMYSCGSGISQRESKAPDINDVVELKDSLRINLRAVLSKPEAKLLERLVEVGMDYITNNIRLPSNKRVQRQLKSLREHIKKVYALLKDRDTALWLELAPLGLRVVNLSEQDQTRLSKMDLLQPYLMALGTLYSWASKAAKLSEYASAKGGRASFFSRYLLADNIKTVLTGAGLYSRKRAGKVLEAIIGVSDHKGPRVHAARYFD